ncbi:uncharacterized protein B0I36DRAFT_115814 [Microdochium trichocladiopsis]|uniref:4'-phosphopantetheinyl transferase domain-containing protein n=1 Tax=Microdochium trichocladiopsis TaxID=1682393 RepID=A0A9P8Y720_9PEZI|nr:uncharacterized protein B0I36DRAFT_115814 [Microdochium trichocladiopsis]KAH7030908.1 hypothetical protein B0I36DRAFT_115814 [Microdochium trichocladiopsis]
MLPFAIGNDICHIPRIYKILSARHGSRFVHKILTQQETQQPRARSVLQCILAPNQDPIDPVTVGSVRNEKLRRAAEYMAGRFAAKEAAIKAHPQHSLTYHQIEIQRMKAHVMVASQAHKTTGSPSEHDPVSSGPPIAIIHPGDGQPSTSASVSISHDGDYATAVCLGFPTSSNNP